MELRAITHVYEQDGIQFQKVIGIYDFKYLKDGIDEVKEAMKQTDTIITHYQEPDDGCDNYFIKYSDGTYFYTSTYEKNKIVGF